MNKTKNSILSLSFSRTLSLSFPLIFAALAATAGVTGLSGCASKPTVDPAMLEKYPGCYHSNPKIANKCIQKNELGEKTTAVELENTQYPGQYK